MNTTFDQIKKLGKLIAEDQHSKQYHDEVMLTRYDSNYLEFKQMPTVSEFQEGEHKLRTFHELYDQTHVKFKFPPNEVIPAQLLSYFEQEKYAVSFLELYFIEASKFKSDEHHSVQIEQVTTDNIEVFLKLNYDEDIHYGQQFAQSKQHYLRNSLHRRNEKLLIAFFEGVPAGSVVLYENEESIEIDNIFVTLAMQRKGVGTQIQREIMQMNPTKTIILVADGEDTARLMYQKQGYTFAGFQFEALKTAESVWI